MKRGFKPVLSGMVLAVWLAGCRTPEQPQTAPADWEVLGPEALRRSHGRIDFVTHVKPVLEAKCVVCHNRKALAALSFESREEVFSAPARIVPGEPTQSRFIINGALNHPRTMPPVGDCLTENEKRIVTAWVRQGAPWPAGPEGRLQANGVER